MTLASTFNKYKFCSNKEVKLDINEYINIQYYSKWGGGSKIIETKYFPNNILHILILGCTRIVIFGSMWHLKD